ncbi:MAG TPA: GAF domain-containing protein [Chloroflexi bacterium]|nr:GAF domain-containing protein [Chloroflexota bacterium]
MIIPTEPGKKQFLQPLVETISLTLNLPASIWLVDEDQKFLHIAAATELPSDYMREVILDLDEPSVGSRVFKNGETIVVQDIASDERWQYKEQAAAVGLKSAMVVPLRADEEVVGVLDVYTHTARDFSDLEKKLVENLASRVITGIIRDARLFEQASTRMGILEKIHQIGNRILSAELSAQGLEEALAQTARSARDTLRADLVDIYQYIEAEDRYVLPPILEGERRDPTVVKDRIYEDDVVVNVVEGGRPLYSPDAQAKTVLTSPFTVVRPDSPGKRFVVREGILSSAALPLKTAGETVGVMFVNYRTRQDFSAEQRYSIELFANQAAVAIRNARLYSEINRRAQAQAVLNEIGRTLTSGIRLEEDDILELIYEQAKKLTGAQDMYIALYDEETSMIRFGFATEHGERVTYESRKANMDERGKTEEVIFTRQPILHRTLEESQTWYGQPGHQEFIGHVAPSWLGIPLIAGEKVLGMIALYDWEREHVYDEQYLQIFSSMANQAAIALDNATLYYEVNQQLERRVEALAALNEVGQSLTSGIRLGENEILELIYEQAKKLTGAQDMYIALYHEEAHTIHFGLATEHGKRADYESRAANMDERGKTEEIIFTRKPILHQTLEESKAWYSQPGHAEFIGDVPPSYLGVPMIAGESILGVIALWDWDHEYAYDKQDLQIFSSMADQAAIALDNARLYAETRQLQEEIIAKGQIATLGTAIAALQHRINNTFNIIVPNVTRLRKRVDMKDETIVEILDIIERNARYTSDIIARIQEPLREVEMQDVDINAVLGEVIDMIKKQWGAEIIVEQELDDNIPLIQAPIGQITEVFSNLSDNACRAMDGNGRLVIASCLNGGIIKVRIQDTGPGIPPRIQERLFQKPVPSRTPEGGAGLGLWLSQLMLQTLGGGVEIEKTGSTGTTMLVQIPA